MVWIRIHVHIIQLHQSLGAMKSKISSAPISVSLRISKLHSILAIANLLAHNNIPISYYVQVYSLRLKSNVASK